MWVDPLKIGQTAGMQKMASVFSSKKKKGKGTAINPLILYIHRRLRACT